MIPQLEKPLLVIKLGGSILTNRAERRSLNNALMPFALKAVRNCQEKYRVMLVFGGGSFGHDSVNEDIFGKSQERVLWHSLALAHFQMLTECEPFFRECNLRYYPVSTTSLATNCHSAHEYIYAHITEIFRMELVPLLTGAIQFETGALPRVCGSDEIVSIYSSILKANKIVFVTDVKGIYKQGGCGIYNTIDEDNVKSVIDDIYQSKEFDTTGGMLSKFKCALDIAAAGMPVAICDYHSFIENSIDQLFSSETDCTKILPKIKVVETC